MIDWTTVTPSTPAANSSCALPGGLLATAVTRPQIVATPASAMTTYASASIIETLVGSARRPMLPERTGRPVRLGVRGDVVRRPASRRSGGRPARAQSWPAPWEPGHPRPDHYGSPACIRGERFRGRVDAGDRGGSRSGCCADPPLLRQQAAALPRHGGTAS